MDHDDEVSKLEVAALSRWGINFGPEVEFYRASQLELWSGAKLESVGAFPQSGEQGVMSVPNPRHLKEHHHHPETGLISNSFHHLKFEK